MSLTGGAYTTTLFSEISSLLNIAFYILKQAKDKQVSTKINKPHANPGTLVLFLCISSCFILGLQQHQHSKEVLSDTCTLQLLVPVPLMVLIVPAAQSVAMRALVNHFCADSDGLSCPLRCLTLLKEWSYIFSTADCPAGIKHTSEKSDNILNHCCLLLH